MESGQRHKQKSHMAPVSKEVESVTLLRRASLVSGPARLVQILGVDDKLSSTHQCSIPKVH